MGVPPLDVVKSHPLLLFSCYLGGPNHLDVHVWDRGVVGDACLATLDPNHHVEKVQRANWVNLFDDSKFPE